MNILSLIFTYFYCISAFATILPFYYIFMLIFIYFYSHLKMTSERSKRRGFVALNFITKSISKKLLIKISEIAEDYRRLPRKIRRCFDLVSINFGSLSIETCKTLRADWSKWYHTCVDTIFIHTWWYHFSRFATTRNTTTVNIINTLLHATFGHFQSALARHPVETKENTFQTDSHSH